VGAARKDVHPLMNSSKIGRWHARELTRWDQGPLWLDIVWKLFLPMLAFLTYGLLALGAALVTYAVIQLIFKA
jgi:hypothetical protein